MAEVRRRRSSTRSTTKPVSRRRDRARDEEPEDDEEDEETTPRASRRRSTRSTSKPSSRRSKAADEEEEDDEDEEDEVDEDEDDEEDEAPRRSRSTKSTSRSRSRSRRDDDEDDDEEEDDEPRVSRRGSSRSRSSSNRRSSTRSRRSSKSKTPPGVRSGHTGVDEVREMAGGGPPRVKLAKAPVLVKLLDKDPPAVTFVQHWVNPGGGARSDRPYTCPGKGCPLCEMGARKSQTIVLNALVLSGVEEPTNKVIQTGIRGWNNLKDQAEDKKGNINVRNGYWAVNVSGKGTDAQTNFRPVKERDLEDDWEEIFENFDPEDLPDIVADAEAEMFGPEIVQVTSKSELRQLARHLADEDDDDDEDEDDD